MSAVIEAARQMELSESAAAHLRADMTPRAAVQALMAAGEGQDALKLLARLLPKRYAVAWVCQCARGQPIDAEDKAGVTLAEQWVRDPSESNRRAAFEFANAGGYKSPGAWIAATAGWAGGSLAPATQKVAVPPPEHLTARAAAAAINFLAGLDLTKYQARRIGFMESALGILGSEGADRGA